MKTNQKLHLVREIAPKPVTKCVVYVESKVEAEFIQALLAHLEAEGISHTELARRAKISQPTISQLLLGKHSPTLRTVDRIAQAINLDVKLRLQKRK